MTEKKSNLYAGEKRELRVYNDSIAILDAAYVIFNSWILTSTTSKWLHDFGFS